MTGSVRPRRLAHLGPRGTYTEAAAIAHDPTADLVPAASVAAAIAAVRAGAADAAVCAIENSIEGGVTETLDQLLQDDFAFRIAAEVVLPIRHALVGPAGLEPRAAKVVYSHPQALAQCRKRLTALAPAARPVAALSTAAAIESALQEHGALAVGNALAAELYGATVYEDDIADAPGNETRFVVVGHTDAPPSGDDKTSIAFTTHHDRPGSLVEVLRAFSERGINLTHIESRPTRRQLGTYVFLVDVQGHRSESGLAEALEEIERETLWLRVFGSYPRWQGPRLAPRTED
jgi:prephenate dehydratase